MNLHENLRMVYWDETGQETVFQVSIKDGGDDLGDVPERRTSWKKWVGCVARFHATMIAPVEKKQEQT